MSSVGHMQTRADLLALKERLISRGWMRGHYGYTDGPNCIVGGLLMVTKRPMIIEEEPDSVTYRIKSLDYTESAARSPEHARHADAVDLLEGIASARIDALNLLTGHHVVDYNDHHAVTFEDILSLIDEALATIPEEAQAETREVVYEPAIA